VRTAAKRDANEQAIIEALKGAGYFVEQLNGEGIPDLLVARVPPSHKARTYWLLLEVKAIGKSTALTAAQQRFNERTEGLPRFVVTTAEKALEAARYWLGGGLDS
jgi:hypothetical protein